jgi:hypothetical protein
MTTHRDNPTPEAEHLPRAASRRDFLFKAGSGLGGLALSTLLAQDGALAAGKATPHSALRIPHSGAPFIAP